MFKSRVLWSLSRPTLGGLAPLISARYLSLTRQKGDCGSAVRGPNLQNLNPLGLRTIWNVLSGAEKLILASPSIDILFSWTILCVPFVIRHWNETSFFFSPSLFVLLSWSDWRARECGALGRLTDGFKRCFQIKSKTLARHKKITVFFFFFFNSTKFLLEWIWWMILLLQIFPR